MPPPKNAMRIFQLLDMSNCRECGEKTCLAFAGAVFQGHRKLAECPKLDQEIIERYSEQPANRDAPEQNRDEYLKKLKCEIADHDLAAAAERVGAQFEEYYCKFSKIVTILEHYCRI
jgi:Na+-translocating ferredoxin:NAD+ oxidoreductase RNF subunit RnfB